MDFSKFLDDNFDVKDWVNAAFKAQKDSPEQKDAQAATLVMKLQLFIQEVNNSLEETSQQALQNLPRVLRDVEAVKQEALFLKEQMQLVKADIKKVEEDTSHSMKMLLEVDVVKSKMKAASDALQEADNWTTLMADVEEVFQSQDPTAIANKLIAMQHSLSMLSHCGDYDERCQHLETLKNRLEAMVSPQIVAAFTTHSLEQAQQYVKIFTDIERLSQLRNYYHRCHKGTLQAQWQQLQQDSQQKPLVDWLPNFTDNLISIWHQEIKWCEQVFPDPVEVVSELLTQTINGLQPSLPSLIDTALQGNPLPVLLEIRQILQRFLKSLENAAQSVTDSLGKSHFFKLVQAVNAPLIPHLLLYGQLEEEHLVQEFTGIQMERRDLIDCAQLLSDSVGKLFKLANEALERCTSLTDGLGSCGLQSALKSLFHAYCERFTSALDLLANIHEQETSKDVASPSEGALGEDWTKFQHALKIIQACGELILQCEEFDLHLSSTLLHAATTHNIQPMSPSALAPMSPRSSISNPFKEFNYLAENDSGQYSKFVKLYTLLSQDESSFQLQSSMDEIARVNELAHKLAFGIVFNQLNKQLAEVPLMEVWRSAGGMLSAELPTFSLSPQEYITKIGQYVMTLPQQLEPFTSQDNPMLDKAMETGRLPYPPEPGSPEVEHLADHWLGSVARGTMHSYVEAILKIPEISPHATRQLGTDIDYLCNVVEALEISASPSLRHIEKLLKIPLSDYGEVRGTIPDRFVHAVGAMRSSQES
ncbi:conserved oligomeric Golgi complex subunit 7-like isoform X2 [Apostichopus japonicus]|uniref:conserved oligomeric Golgi complex subunit 7-like isoform X2 n=1 Tax=Stichopus japonicus TaxID=307972 RepID=UPI003AB8B32A